MFALYRTLSLRYLRMRWGLNVLVVLSIGLGVSVWVATSALYESLEQSILVSLNPMAGIADLYLSNGDAGVRRDLDKRVAAVRGVKDVRPVVIKDVRVILDGRPWQAATLFGIDLPEGAEADPSFHDVKVGEIDRLAAAVALATGRTPVVVGHGLETMLPPDQRRLRLMIAGRPQEVTRVGTIEASGSMAVLGGNVLVTKCDLAARLAGRPGRVTRMDIVLQPDADHEAVARAIRAELNEPDAGQVRTPQAEDNRVRETLEPLKVGSLIVSAGALVVGMFLVYNTLSVSVAERRHDIGVLRSLGATRDQVRRLFQGEAIFLGVLGVLVGIPFGLALAQLTARPDWRAGL